MTRPRPFLSSLVLAVLCALISGDRPALAREVTNYEWNYQLDLPEGWTDENAKPAWEKEGIRGSWVHRLEKLDDGKPAQGEGGRATMSVLPAPKGKTLAELAADPAQRAFLLNHFGKESAWPAVEAEETKVLVSQVGETEGSEAEVPAVLLKTQGQALNLAEVDATKCRGSMMVTLAGGKLFRLKLLCWPTQDDAEGVRVELDVIEVSFALIKLKKEAVKPDPNAGDGAGGASGNGGGPKEPVTEKVVGDSDKDFMIDDLFVIEGWKVKKPKKLATQAIDKAKDPNMRVSLGNNDTMGACAVTFHVYPNAGFNALGAAVPAPDLKLWLTKSWWQTLQSTFAMGPLITYPWPKRKGGEFLQTPLMTKEAEQIIAAEPKDRAKADIDVDAVLKMKAEPFVEEVVKPTFGKLKCQAAYRGVIKGNAKTIGPMLQIRYAWKTEKYTYFIFVQIQRDGLKRYEAPVKEFLESLEITK